MKSRSEASVEIRPLAVAAGAFLVLVGSVVLSRQDLYINTGVQAGVEQRSLNVWGLGIACGLLIGGTLAVLSALAEWRRVALVAAMLSTASAVWHPLLWLAIPATVPLWLMATSSETVARSR